MLIGLPLKPDPPPPHRMIPLSTPLFSHWSIIPFNAALPNIRVRKQLMTCSGAYTTTFLTEKI
jgi:hypothetical protein